MTVLPNDSVYLSWPGNLNTDIPFYDETALFRGVYNNVTNTVDGTWNCSPLNLEEGGYTDIKGTAKGDFQLKEFK